MNSKKKTNIIIAAILLFTLVVTLLYYPKVPDIIPVHWGVDGQIDGWGQKYMLFVFWGIAAGVNFLMLFAEKIEPKEGSYDKFRKVFDIMRLFVTGLMCGLVLLTIAFTFNPQFADMNGIMYPAMGIMFVLLGNYMPKVKHNYTFGIKTPWALASETVWNKTHRISGPLWMAEGAVIFSLAFVKNTTVASIIMLITMIVVIIIPMVYSYFEFKKEKESLNNEKDD